MVHSLVLISTNLIKQIEIEFNKVFMEKKESQPLATWAVPQPEQMLPNSSAAFIL